MLSEDLRSLLSIIEAVTKMPVCLAIDEAQIYSTLYPNNVWQCGIFLKVKYREEINSFSRLTKPWSSLLFLNIFCRRQIVLIFFVGPSYDLRMLLQLQQQLERKLRSSGCIYCLPLILYHPRSKAVLCRIQQHGIIWMLCLI